MKARSFVVLFCTFLAIQAIPAQNRTLTGIIGSEDVSDLNLNNSKKEEDSPIVHDSPKVAPTAKSPVPGTLKETNDSKSSPTGVHLTSDLSGNDDGKENNGTNHLKLTPVSKAGSEQTSNSSQSNISRPKADSLGSPSGESALPKNTTAKGNDSAAPAQDVSESNPDPTHNSTSSTLQAVQPHSKVNKSTENSTSPSSSNHPSNSGSSSDGAVDSAALNDTEVPPSHPHGNSAHPNSTGTDPGHLPRDPSSSGETPSRSGADNDTASANRSSSTANQNSHSGTSAGKTTTTNSSASVNGSQASGGGRSATTTSESTGDEAVSPGGVKPPVRSPAEPKKDDAVSQNHGGRNATQSNNEKDTPLASKEKNTTQSNSEKDTPLASKEKNTTQQSGSENDVPSASEEKNTMQSNNEKDTPLASKEKNTAQPSGSEKDAPSASEEKNTTQQSGSEKDTLPASEEDEGNSVGDENANDHHVGIAADEDSADKEREGVVKVLRPHETDTDTQPEDPLSLPRSPASYDRYKHVLEAMNGDELEEDIALLDGLEEDKQRADYDWQKEKSELNDRDRHHDIGDDGESDFEGDGGAEPNEASIPFDEDEYNTVKAEVRAEIVYDREEGRGFTGRFYFFCLLVVGCFVLALLACKRSRKVREALLPFLNKKQSRTHKYTSLRKTKF